MHDKPETGLHTVNNSPYIFTWLLLPSVRTKISKYTSKSNWDPPPSMHGNKLKKKIIRRVTTFVFL